ncbi:MAG TPA: hypothetical protein VHR72_03345 [Gemmataceae bacterium]|jgi:hypothetical protein|nr:hypothetical protein [Gemmataceae bacterium]
MNVRLWIAAALLVVSSIAPGQESGPTPVSLALRDVINEGADLFNQQADHAGCYRLYQGSLVAIRPMLETWQKRYVDEALTQASAKTTSAEKAYCLREAIDRIRAEAGTPGEELLRAMPERVDEVK